MKTTINDSVVRYEDSGSGPAIVVLHGDPSNREIGKIFEPLSRAGYRVIVTHLEGMGKKRPEKVDPQGNTRNAVALLNFLGIGRAVFFGLGVGGIVLLDLLDQSPHRVAAASLVLGSATAERVRNLTGRPEISTALKEGRLSGIREELLAVLPSAGKDNVASSYPQLRSWVDNLRNKIIYFSAVRHRSALLADMGLPPLIVEPEEGGANGKPPARIASFASRGWKKIKGANAHLAALMQSLFPQEEEIDEDEIVSDLP